MKFFRVWIEGTASLIQHRFDERAEREAQQQTRQVTSEPVLPRQVAERHVYRIGDKPELHHPGGAIARLLREAGSNHRLKGSRKSTKYVVPAGVLVMDDLIPLFAPDRTTRLVSFEVDSRPVVIPATKGRIMRHRPRLDEWAAVFVVRIIPDVITEQLVRQLVIEGGQRLGIGDFRPEKGGPFGTFDVVSWEQLRDEDVPRRVRVRVLPAVAELPS